MKSQVFLLLKEKAPLSSLPWMKSLCGSLLTERGLSYNSEMGPVDGAGLPNRRETKLLELTCGSKSNLGIPEKTGPWNQWALQQGSGVSKSEWTWTPDITSHTLFSGLLTLAASTSLLGAQYLRVEMNLRPLSTYLGSKSYTQDRWKDPDLQTVDKRKGKTEKKKKKTLPTFYQSMWLKIVRVFTS